MSNNPTDQLILLAQMSIEDDNTSIRSSLNSHMPLLFIVIVGIALTVGGIYTIEKWEEQIQSTYLTGSEQLYKNNLYEKLDALRARARMCRAFFMSSESVEASEFKEFSASLLDENDKQTFIAATEIIRDPVTSKNRLRALFPPRSNGPTTTDVEQIYQSEAVLAAINPGGTSLAYTMTMSPAGTTNHDTMLLYFALHAPADKPSILIISGALASTIFENQDQDSSAINYSIHGSENLTTDLGTEDTTASDSDQKHLLLNFENMSFDLVAERNHPLLQKSKLMKWALAIFSLLFTCLLTGQFLFAKRAVRQLATLAVQRANDLTSINSDLTDEIMNRIKFQAELLERTSEIQEANRKLEDVQNQMVQQEKLASLGQLAAGVAHEINNPIGFINSNLTMLEKYSQRILKVLDVFLDIENFISDTDKQQQIEAVKKEAKLNSLMSNISAVIAESKEGVERVKRIVQDLKDFSRVDEAEWQWVNLHDGIDSTLNIARNEIKYKATVHKEYGEIPLVECVPSQINQVVMNLLVNAAQAMKDSGDITIRTRTQNKNVLIEIEDTGSGIPPDVIGKIFDPFFTTKEVGKGTGLGLSLSYGIIKKHSGDLKVKSEPGKGTQFTIILPISTGTSNKAE